ncbi:MAG: DUF6586 family protein [Pseudomonadota bacterium]
MSGCRGRANRKLYHAAILLHMLESELTREHYPANIVLDATAPAIRQHLLGALGWFLLELAEVQSLPEHPPESVKSLQVDFGLAEPLRGELIEISGLEQSGWLAELQATPPESGAVQTPPGGAAPGGANLLVVAQQSWSAEQLRSWYSALEGMIDRLGHGLDEW